MAVREEYLLLLAVIVGSAIVITVLANRNDQEASDASSNNGSPELMSLYPAGADGRRHQSLLRHPPEASLAQFHQLVMSSTVEKGDLLNVLEGLGNLHAYSRPAMVVVGAHNGGEANDPAFKLTTKALGPFEAWEKLFIEPVPVIYEQLTKNLAGTPASRVKTANMAVTGRSSSPKDFIRLFCWGRESTGNLAQIPGGSQSSDSPLPAPAWYAQTCSTNPGRFLHPYDMQANVPKGGYGRMARKDMLSRLPIDEVKVPAASLADILAANGIDQERVQYLQIDVEGGDFDVIRSLPFPGYGGLLNPQVVVYEHVLMNTTTATKARNWLRDRGKYEFCHELGQNTFCIL